MLSLTPFRPPRYCTLYTHTPSVAKKQIADRKKKKKKKQNRSGRPAARTRQAAVAAAAGAAETPGGRPSTPTEAPARPRRPCLRVSHRVILYPRIVCTQLCRSEKARAGGRAAPTGGEDKPYETRRHLRTSNFLKRRSRKSIPPRIGDGAG